jgi:hypothetical protein
MKRADLEGLSLEELYRVAAAQGILEAAGLPRETLIERLASDRPRKKAGVAAPPPPASPGKAKPSSQPSARKARKAAAPPEAAEEAPPGADRSGPRAAAAPRRHSAGIPSGVAPDRPQGHDTESMARLYLEQGEYARAAGLFRDLLRLRPDDPELSDGLLVAERAEAGLRTGAPAGAVPADPPEPPPPPRPAPGEPIGMLDLEEPPDTYGLDECELLFKDPHYVFVYWEVTERGLGAARRDLGDEASDARLVVRLFAQHDRADRGSERESRDHFVDWNNGRRYFASPRPGARVRAAIGLVTPSGLFAPIAHSSQIHVPPAEPAVTVATDWLEVTPARTRGLAAEPIGLPARGAGTGERVVPLGPGGGARASANLERGGASERIRPPGSPSGSSGPPDDGGTSPTLPWRSRPGSKQ